MEEKTNSLSATIDRLNPFVPQPPPSGPADSLVIRGDRLEAEASPPEHSGDYTLAGAYELYRRGDYDHAQQVFHHIAENKKNPPQVAEEARFFEAESLRRQGNLPKAADTYAKMLTDFPSGRYREQALQHTYDIANFWLDDTRTEIDQYKQVQDGSRWFVMPAWLQFNWEKSKPLFDMEGRAIEKLEQVRYNDMTGPLADRALFLMGSVKFYREDYKEAEHYFTQVVEMHPNSPLAEQSVELAIIAKHMSTGGSDYDGRKVAEARQLVDVALRNYPNLAMKKQEFLERQLFGITMQQAEKDYKMAEFYRRTGRPGSAYFYYEIVRRRYTGTAWAEKATERMLELRAKVEKENAKVDSGS
jgi:TolA-binding protein